MKHLAAPVLKRWTLAAGAVLTALLGVAPEAAEIDACKHFRVADLAADTVGLDAQLAAQGASRGFTMLAAHADVPPAEAFMVCTVVGSWLGSLETGSLTLRVINEADGNPVAAAEVRASNKLGFEHMLRSAAEKAYAALEYAGFRADAYRARTDRLYPSRPTYEVSKVWLAEWKPRHPLEGVWTDAEGASRLAILPSPKGLPGTHIGVVLESASPLWRVGEIKIEFTGTASPTADPMDATFYLLNKQPVATTFSVTPGGALEATISTPAGRQLLRLTRAAE